MVAVLSTVPPLNRAQDTTLVPLRRPLVTSPVLPPLPLLVTFPLREVPLSANDSHHVPKRVPSS